MSTGPDVRYAHTPAEEIGQNQAQAKSTSPSEYTSFFQIGTCDKPRQQQTKEKGGKGRD